MLKAYYDQLRLAFSLRVVVLSAILSLMGWLAGCTHNIDLSSKGGLTKLPFTEQSSSTTEGN